MSAMMARGKKTSRYCMPDIIQNNLPPMMKGDADEAGRIPRRGIVVQGRYRYLTTCFSQRHMMTTAVPGASSPRQPRRTNHRCVLVLILSQKAPPPLPSPEASLISVNHARELLMCFMSKACRTSSMWGHSRHSGRGRCAPQQRQQH